MCGISGIINKNNRKVSREEIKKINDLIIHRGSDDEGYYFGENFAFGHRRLAILDLSDSGHQPMEYKGRYGEYVITYNGEIYNYIELKNELIKEGYQFKSNTDTEVILASYDKWGEYCVNKFNGMWAFAIYDKKRGIIFCSRDRFGIKPFYYTEIDGKFIFGSEIKQFAAVKNWQPILNTKRAYDFLEYGLFDHTNETLFENVYQLRGGYNLVYNLKRHKFEIYKWYDLKNRINKIKNTNLSFEEAVSKFKNIFYDSIKLRLRSDVKVGSCLSGGLDSSSIVCVVNDLLKNSNKNHVQETVSSCFKIKKFDEQDFIDEVVKHTMVKSHKVFPQFDSLFNELDNIIWHQDEPFGSTSIFAQWNVFKEAKKNNLIVMLDGQGADELLAGYHSFFGAFLIGLLKKGKIAAFIRELKAIRHIHRYSYGYIFALIVSKITEGNLKAFLRKVYNKKTLIFNNRFKSKQHKETFTAISELSYEQTTNINLPMLLHYEDRNSMAFSIESRVPFLDYRLVEFTLSLPDHYKIKNGQTKAILREAMKGILPNKIRNRQDKMGFVTPEEIWIKRNKDIFLDKIKESIQNSSGLIKANAIEYFNKVIEGQINFDFTIWRIIIFNEWIKKFNIKIK